MHSNIFAKLNLATVSDDILQTAFRKIGAELEVRNMLDVEDKRLLRVFSSRNRGISIKLKRGNTTIPFEELDAQDWTHLFPNCDETRKYYVYAHMTTGRKHRDIRGLAIPFGLIRLPMYIGKGTGDRAFMMARNQGHGAILRNQKLISDVETVPVKILRSDLTESEAFALESKLIYFFGTKYEIGRSGVLVNLDVPKRPTWCNGMLTSFDRPVAAA